MQSKLSPSPRCLRAASAVALLGVLAMALALAPGALAATGGAAAPGTPAKPASRHSKARTSSVATWFGPGFYGRQTACGQVLTPHVVGVAHRTLPCGTLVRITYKGRSVVVPVLDRGPYSRLAEWDLTAGAAQALEVSETVRITTKVVGSAPNSPTLGLTAPSGGGAPTPLAPAPLAGGALAG
jgi:rare lipoprotein A (peptidoglycan hydrolase)